MSGRASRALLAVVLALALLPLAAAPAAAIHQNCGEKYPRGTLSNGHPDLTKPKSERGWAGDRQLYMIESALLSLESASGALEIPKDLLDSIKDALVDTELGIYRTGVPIEPIHHAVGAIVRVVAEALAAAERGMAIANLVIVVASTAVSTTKLAYDLPVGVENSCGSTLSGDSLDNLWVSVVERALSSNGPPLGSLLVPAEHPESTAEWPLMPQHDDTEFPWCPPLDSLGEALPQASGTQPTGPAQIADTGGTCSPGYHTGYLDAPYIGVDAVVANTIAHATAHGVPTRHADGCLALARREKDAGRYKAAFAYYRQAYQQVTSLDVVGPCHD